MQLLSLDRVWIYSYQTIRAFFLHSEPGIANEKKKKKKRTKFLKGVRGYTAVENFESRD